VGGRFKTRPVHPLARQKENKDIKHTVVMTLHNKYVIMVAFTVIPVADDSPTNIIFVQNKSAHK